MDDTIMEKGKWKGKTYKYIRVHDPSYVLYLVAQPAGTVISYFEFIQYCMCILKTDDTTTVTDSSRKNIIGYVYCFSNESLPGIYKIGFTRRPIKYRLKEANRGGTWSVPTPFIAEIVIKVKDPMFIEKCIHSDLKEYRLDASREFFRVSIEHIQSVFQKYKKTYPDRAYLTNIGKKWTTEEENILLDELDKNISIEVIAKTHKRTVGGIISRQRTIAYNMYVKNVSIGEIIIKTRLNKEQIIEAIKRIEENPRNKEKKVSLFV
jgi:hypothetical protein